MSKTKILLIQIAGCLALGAVLGIAFWLFDGGKREPDCKFDEIRNHKYKTGVGTTTASFGASKQSEGWVTIQRDAKETVYRGRWHKDGR